MHLLCLFDHVAQNEHKPDISLDEDIFEEAVDAADNHRGALATLVAAVALWFAHFPLKSLFSDDQDEGGDEAEENTNPHDESQTSDDN